MAVACPDYYTDFNDSFDVLPTDRDNFEYKQSAPAPTLKGRLKSRVSYWESINANCFIVDVLKNSVIAFRSFLLQWLNVFRITNRLRPIMIS